MTVSYLPHSLLFLIAAEANGTGGEALTLLTSNEPDATSLSQIELSEADDRMKRFYGEFQSLFGVQPK